MTIEEISKTDIVVLSGMVVIAISLMTYLFSATKYGKAILIKIMNVLIHNIKHKEFKNIIFAIVFILSLLIPCFMISFSFFIFGWTKWILLIFGIYLLVTLIYFVFIIIKMLSDTLNVLTDKIPKE